MSLPRTMRVRFADLQNIAADAARTETRAANAAGIADSLLQRRVPARSSAAERQTVAPAPAEPLETVDWETMAGDSVIARRLTGIDVLVLRLFIRGDEVTGTAAAQTSATPPVRVTGRRVSCDGSF
jgi:hypothetical protein